ncbi:3-hydroxyacyl-[acyl-carrier-protein] dehydratase FabZ [Candidatus Microgenomates bacterium]|nr:3-hydroxyacyl-[acyl-carrier-protein] dehydratase FabZ [Candidatus Microgenomates bacterium]
MGIEQKSLAKGEITGIIPHRDPILFLESVEHVEFGVNARGKMRDWTQDPEIGDQNFPQALVAEVLSQLGAVVILGMPENKRKIGILAGVDNFTFGSPLTPGEEVILEANISRMRHNFGKGHVRAMVNNKVRAEGDITFALTDKTP